VAVSSSHLAFTGMNTGPPLLLGLILLGLGALLVVHSATRRSAPGLTVPVDRSVSSHVGDQERSSP
jgi:hypothetical protein